MFGLTLGLSGCEKLGLEDPAKVAEKIEAEGKAIGGACRHAGRAIEDCYTMNGRASKSAMFDGWREMNDYMLQNKIEVVKPVLVHAEESAATKSTADPAKAEELHEKSEVTHEEEAKPAVIEAAPEAKEVKEEKKPKRKRKVPRKETAQESRQEEPPAPKGDHASGPINK